jgi:hypothetical protein
MPFGLYHIFISVFNERQGREVESWSSVITCSHVLRGHTEERDTRGINGLEHIFVIGEIL